MIQMREMRQSRDMVGLRGVLLEGRVQSETPLRLQNAVTRATLGRAEVDTAVLNGRVARRIGVSLPQERSTAEQVFYTWVARSRLESPRSRR